MIDSELPLPVKMTAAGIEKCKDTEESDYPSVELAYAIAISSYETVTKRLDAMDGRIQTMLAFASTTTAVVPTAAKAAGLSFRSAWLYCALIAFVLQLFLGTYARLVGAIKLLKPEIFYEKWLHKSPWAFKKDLIYWASKDFNDNADLLRTRWRLTVLISLLFFAEVGLLLIWIANASKGPSSQ